VSTLERLIDQGEILRQGVTQISGQIRDYYHFWPSVRHPHSLVRVACMT
jgi:hypothetical protein